MNQIQNLPLLENEAVSRLSPSAEIFFHRLLNAVDRYGCFDARIPILHSRLYAFTLHAITEQDITAWLAECVDAGLVQLYTVNGLPYLCVAGFKRRVGSSKTPYPAPPQAAQLTGGTKFEQGNKHDEFLQDIYKRENEQFLASLCIRVRYPEIKPQWLQQFNEHLRTEHKQYTEGHEWLSHLKRWLYDNIYRLRNEEEPVVTQRRAFEAA